MGMGVGSRTISTPSRADHAADMADYLAGGERRARQVDNRGPVRLGEGGRLHPDIVDAYWEQGFYVFEGVVGEQELDELRAGAADMIVSEALIQTGLGAQSPQT